MSPPAAARHAEHLERLEAISRCAFDLAQAAHRIALRNRDNVPVFLAAATEFRHCAFTQRMGYRLIHGGLETRSQAPRGQAEPVRETAGAEPRATSERCETARERDRDQEPVSLPRFLTSLGVITAEAEQRGDQYPDHIRETVLPTLKRLRAEVTAEAGTEIAAEPKREREMALAGPAAPRLAPPRPPPARARFMGSAAAFAPGLHGLSPRRESG